MSMVMRQVGGSATSVGEAASRRWRSLGPFAAVLVLLVVTACSDDGDESLDPPGDEGVSAAPQVKSVVVISLDTVRADRLEPYGYARGTSPNLAGLAQRSVVFERAQAQAPQTAPSHASLFTSTYPSAHGIVNVHSQSTHAAVLPPQTRTLAEELSAAGVETAAFVSGGNLTRTMGMDRGYDVWDEKNEDFSARADRFLEWVTVPGRGRFFAVLHTYQAHAPYLPPAELVPQFTDSAYRGVLRERLGRYLAMPAEEAWAGAVGPDYWDGMLDYDAADVGFLSDLYDAELAYADSVLRRVLATLLASPFAADTAIVVLSDHGEEFMDHGKYQHDQLYEELLHVPLVIRLPSALERAGWKGRVSTPAELIDVAPTVAELMGVRAPAAWSGRSLVPDMDPDGAGTVERPRFSELELERGPKRYRSVTMNDWKYIHVHQVDIDRTWEFLFDLSRDPGEANNLMGSEDDVAKQRVVDLRRLLDDYLAHAAERAETVGRGAAVGLSDEERARLEALGYLGGDR